MTWETTRLTLACWMALLLGLAACSKSPKSLEAEKDVPAVAGETAGGGLLDVDDAGPEDEGPAAVADAGREVFAPADRGEVEGKLYPSACTGDAECALGHCVPHVSGRVCSPGCVERDGAECPTGWVCAEVEGGRACLSRWASVCRPCIESAACALPGVCIERGRAGVRWEMTGGCSPHPECATVVGWHLGAVACGLDGPWVGMGCGECAGRCCEPQVELRTQGCK